MKLKVTYRQINTCGYCLRGGNVDSFKDVRYNPEKIITIQVTDGTTAPVSSTTASSGTATTSSTTATSSVSTSSTTSSSVPSAPLPSDTASSAELPVNTVDEETGIKLEAAPGVVPPDTVIQAQQVTEGGNFTIVNNALEHISDKWVAYDISLISNQAEIQPNGNVKITIPRPLGLNMNKMVLYHVADDGTLTQIPFTMDKTKDHLIFETDHFSLYAVAEVEAAYTEDKPDQTANLWWLWCVIGGVVLVGAGIAIWYLKFRKKTSGK